MRWRYWTLVMTLVTMALILGAGSLAAQDMWWKQPNGIHMPDFDQRQAGLGNYFCGPTAAGNCLWWFHRRYPNWGIVPPGMQPVQFIQQLGNLMHCNPGTGTYWDSLAIGIEDWFEQQGLADSFTVDTVWNPTYEFCRGELMRCQDVILLVGWWECYNIIPIGGDCFMLYWERQGGHFVTMAGVDPVGQRTAHSDPWWDNAEAGGAGRVVGPNHNPPCSLEHNDGISASHDEYPISTLGISPGGVWEILGGYGGSKGDMDVFKGLNPNPRLAKQIIDSTEWCGPLPPWVHMGARVAEVEGAVVVCPVTTDGVIPTLTEWGMIIFVVLLLGFMAWTIVRRRRAAALRM